MPWMTYQMYALPKITSCILRTGGKQRRFKQALISWRRVWRYQRDNQNPYIEEEQTTQWPKEKVQKYKQRSTKHTYKTKDRVTRTPLKTGGELRCSGRVGSSCYTSGTRRVNLVTQHRLTRGKLPVPKTMTYPSYAVCVIELNPLLMNRQYI